MPPKDGGNNLEKWIGWKRKNEGKFGPISVNLGDSMDPVRLAENGKRLNLSPMKWRLAPELNLVIVRNTSFLLLGSRTLGCSVALNLNEARSEVFEIPMPGHATDVAFKLNGSDVFPSDHLSELISEHDVIFLLTDTRESCWLPTVLARHHKKIAVIAALGFDSYLVMRHDSHDANKPLGCYFCNDVTAPGNVLSAYKEEGMLFLQKVYESTTFLENLSGISKLLNDPTIDYIVELNDEEDF